MQIKSIFFGSFRMDFWLLRKPILHIFHFLFYCKINNCAIGKKTSLKRFPEIILFVGSSWHMVGTTRKAGIRLGTIRPKWISALIDQPKHISDIPATRSL